MSADRETAFAHGESPRARLLEKLAADFERQHGVDLRDDRIAMERLEEAVDLALQELETHPSTRITVPSLSADASGSQDLDRVVTREDLEAVEGYHPERYPPDPQPSRRFVSIPERPPLVTFSLMAVSILMYLMQVLTGAVFGQDLPAALGVKANSLIVAGQYWRLFSPMLLHGSLIHLGFNMYALYILGQRLERYFGHVRFFSLYAVSGFAGNILSFYLTPASSLGSSTAIFGLLGAEGVFIYQHRKLFGERFKGALRQIIQVAVINLIIGLSPGIDNWGHIGGLLGGVAFTWFAGPVFKIEGLDPDLRLVDQRSESSALAALVVQGAALAVLAGLIILSRR
jgi:rhomboid protease GluP